MSLQEDELIEPSWHWILSLSLTFLQKDQLSGRSWQWIIVPSLTSLKEDQLSKRRWNRIISSSFKCLQEDQLTELSFASDNTSPSVTSLQEDQLTELSFALDQLSTIYAPSRKSNDFIVICIGIPLHHLRPFRKMKWLNFHLHWITSPSLTSLQEDELTLFIFALDYPSIINTPSGRSIDWTVYALDQFECAFFSCHCIIINVP